MNEAHKRRITATFRHVDGLLQEAERVLSNEGGGSSFQDLIPDATPIQHRVIADLVRQIRGRMVAALDRMDITLGSPTVPATRAALTHLMFAEVDLEDLDPKRITGYGLLPEEQAQILREGCADILALLEQARTFLEARTASDLEARSAALTAPEASQRMLQELARVITSQGLVGLRPALGALLTAAEEQRFEVAVFGRVSSGKSSLLNRILGQAVLPVGATPVTALVTHLVHGPEPRVHVRFAQTAIQSIDLGELADYVTEQGNPANQKQVVSVHIEVPNAHLQRGVAFVDTPGLGSLAHAGAGETLAYLPRADLALLLTDATSALSPGDLLLLASLQKAGIRAMVVLSKADLLTPEDRLRVRDYVAGHLKIELEDAVPVHLVSVVGSEAALADQWFAEVLEPMLGNHQEERNLALARKAESLRAQVLSLLRRHLRQDPSGVAVPAPPSVEQGEAAIRKAATAPDRILADCRDLFRTLPEMVDRLEEGLITEILEGESEDLPARLRVRIEEPVAEVVRQVLDHLEEGRVMLARALELAGGEPSPLPEPRDLPLFGGGELIRLLDSIRAPSPLLPRGVRRHLVQWNLRKHLGEDLSNALNAHRRRLDAWCQGALSALGEAFQARVGVLRTTQGMGGGDGRLTPEMRDSLEADILALDKLEGVRP